MSGSRSFGGNRGDNNRNVRRRVDDQAPPAVPPVPVAPPQLPVPPVPVVAPPQLPVPPVPVVAPPQLPVPPVPVVPVVAPPQLHVPPVPVVAPPQLPVPPVPVVAPPQPPPAGGGDGAPLVQVREYLVIPGFPPYPLNGVQTNVYQLFKKSLSHSDVFKVLQVTGKNLPNFSQDVGDLCVARGDKDTEYNVRLTLVRGNEIVADGDIKLKRHDLGNPVSLPWRLFALENHVPLDGNMEGKVIYAWCEWVNIVGVEKKDLRIIIKLPNY